MSTASGTPNWQDLSGIRRKRTNLINSLLVAAKLYSRENHAEVCQQINQAESLLNTIIDRLRVDQPPWTDLVPDARTESEWRHDDFPPGPGEIVQDSNHQPHLQESFVNMHAVQEIPPGYVPAQSLHQQNGYIDRPNAIYNEYSVETPDPSHSGYYMPMSALENHRMNPNNFSSENERAGEKRARAAETENRLSTKRSRTSLQQTSHPSSNATASATSINSGESTVNTRPSKSASSQSSGNMAPLRRPTTAPKVLSYNWDMVNDERKRRLSHFGYIEETEAGMLAPKPCTHCSHYTWGYGKDRAQLVCKVYKPETVGNYTKAIKFNWKRCSHCWMSGRDCSLVRDAEKEACDASAG